MDRIRGILPIRFLLITFVVVVFGTPVSAGDEGVTARDIYQMHRDGLSERVLLEHLNVNGFSGLLTRDRVRTLRTSGVPRSVIQRMRRLQEQNRTSAKQEEQNTSARNASQRGSPGPSRQNARNGRLELTSRAARTIWFRIDRSNHTLHLSSSEQNRFVGLSKKNTVQLPVPSGTWYVSRHGSDRAKQVKIAPGATARVEMIERDRRRIVFHWYGPESGADGRRLVLTETRTTNQNQTVRRARRRARRASRSRQHRNRLEGPYISFRTGYFVPYGGRFFPKGYISPHGSVRWQYHGYRGLNGIRTGRHTGFRYGRRSRFDFQLNLDHDFGKGNLRGSLRFRSGHRNARSHFSCCE